jgi:ABC-2 type transport system permease protein
VIYVLGESVLFDYLEMPLRGHAWLLVLAAILFIFACQLLGTLLVVVTLRMGTALSIAGSSPPRRSASWASAFRASE